MSENETEEKDYWKNFIKKERKKMESKDKIWAIISISLMAVGIVGEHFYPNHGCIFNSIIWYAFGVTCRFI